MQHDCDYSRKNNLNYWISDRTNFRSTGASIPPWDHDAFSPLFQISPPLFQKIFRTFWKFLTILPFPEKFLHFHPPKFLMTFFFFGHRPQISTSPPIFAVSVHFPLFRENYSFPLLLQISPCFRQIHLLFTYFTCTFPPTFTMMHLCITQCTYWTPLGS